LVLDAVRFYKVEIVALYLGEAGKYRLDWKLRVVVDHADVFAGGRASSPRRMSHPRPPLFGSASTRTLGSPSASFWQISGVWSFEPAKNSQQGSLSMRSETATLCCEDSPQMG
jgi:hypothetical protein